MNTIRTAEYPPTHPHQHISLWRSPQAFVNGVTYAAVAAKLSNGFATVIVEVRDKKTTINTVMMASGALVPQQT